ncbi:MAG: Rha family transcriptional regulator [Dolichospermum sp.]
MNSITVIEQGDVLVVDSRLIADELGIEHHTFLKTLNKYLDRIELRFGVVRFEVDKPSEGSLGGRPEKFALLTESQATTLMTFFKNTEKVIDCKLALVEAFEKAKSVIKSVIPQQNNLIRELELRLQLAQAETQKALAEKAVLDTRHLIVATCPEPVQQKILGYEVVKEIEYRDRIIQDNQVINDGSTVSKTELCKRCEFTTKAGNPDYTKLKKHLDPLKIPDYTWKDVPSVRDNQELRRDYLGELDRMIMDDSRQLWFMES